MDIVGAAPLVNRESKKHPKEMYAVAFTAMWDTFSFYGMKALLIAYIVTQLKLGQPMGYAILGTYSALVFAGLGFMLLWAGCYWNSTTGLMPVAILITDYFFLELGEICLGPVAFSLASNLSPKAIVTTLIGIMYLSISLGEYLSGKLGSLMAVPEGLSNPIAMMPYFSAVFLKIAVGGVSIAILIMLLIPQLKKWMQEVN